MTLDISQLFLFSIFTSSLHWLIARSEIARPIWSRASGWFGKLLACAGCSGFWLGGLIGGSGLISPLTPAVAPILYIDVALGALAHGVLGVFVTPVLEAVLLWGLRESAIEAASEPADEPGSVPTPMPHSNSAAITPVDNPSRGHKS